MSGEIYTYVATFSFNSRFYSSEQPKKDSIVDALNTVFMEYQKKLINLRMYRSVRHDCDVIFWLSSHDPMDMSLFKESVMKAMGGYGKARYSMFSLYEHSPYLRDARSLEDTLRFAPKTYFIAYPMSKTPDWYLIDHEERKKILAEHIAMATSHPENQDIRSYTTYSYGLGDQEFVVLYETDSLSQWSHVTGKLREARARKWIIKEEPILIGILSEPLKF
ncbi:MAG: chlorite dismutase family protein [Thermoplasmataceae archaeon]